jgi:preprotein translocase subunit SecE
MAVEAKRMEKSGAAGANGDNLFGRTASGFKGSLERVRTFYSDVRNEMRKVTTPSRKEVQATTSVVLVAVFIFGVYFWFIDNVIGRGVDYLFRFFTK